MNKALRRIGLALKSFTVVLSGKRFFVDTLPNSFINYEASVGEGRTSSVIMAPVRWIMRTFSEAPMMLEKASKDGIEPISYHPMLELLAQGNPYYDGALLMKSVLADLVLTGNAYILKGRSGTGRPVELWWAPASLVEPKWPDDGSAFISHYEYMPRGSPIAISVEDIIHFRDGIDPDNIRKGLSPLKSLFREIYTDNEASNTTSALLKNSGVPGVILSPGDDSSISEAALQDAKLKFKEAFTGDKRGEPLVISGKTKVDSFGFSPQQMDLKTLRRIPEERVSAVLGVPAIVCGLGAGLDRATYANFAEAREVAYESCIIPYQRLVAAVLKRQLLEDFEGNSSQWNIAFDLRGVRVLQEDVSKTALRAVQLVQGGLITVGEAREMVGLLSDDSHAIYLRPMAVFEVPAKKALGKTEMKAIRMTQRQRQLMLALRRDADMLEMGFSKRLDGLFSEMGRRARAAFEVDLLKAQKADPDDAQLVRQMLLRLALEQFQKDKMVPLFQAQYKLTAETVYGTVNRMLDLSLFLDDPVAKRIMEIGGRRVGLIDLEGQAKESLFSALAEGRDKGESTQEIARRIQDKISAGRYHDTVTRAQVISRTEVKYAQFNSSVEAFERSGVVSGYMLLDAQLGPTDFECEARNGQIVTAEEAREAMEREHPNGTLSVVPVVG